MYFYKLFLIKQKRSSIFLWWNVSTAYITLNKFFSLSFEKKKNFNKKPEEMIVWTNFFLYYLFNSFSIAYRKFDYCVWRWHNVFTNTTIHFHWYIIGVSINIIYSRFTLYSDNNLRILIFLSKRGNKIVIYWIRYEGETHRSENLKGRFSKCVRNRRPRILSTSDVFIAQFFPELLSI